MAVRTITAEIDGRVRKITADIPDGATEDEIIGAIRSYMQQPAGAPAGNRSPQTIDQAVRAGGSLPGITPGVAGMPQPAAPARLRSSPWERARAAAIQSEIAQESSRIPHVPMQNPGRDEILRVAGSSPGSGISLREFLGPEDWERHVNSPEFQAASREIPAPTVHIPAKDQIEREALAIDPNAVEQQSAQLMAQAGQETGKAISSAIPRLEMSKDPAVLLKNAMYLSEADGGLEVTKILNSVEESKREETLRRAAELARDDFQQGLAQYVPPPQEGEPGANTVAKSAMRTILGLASAPQSGLEMAALGGLGRLARTAVNSPKVVAALRNSPRLRQGVDVAGAIAVPGGMAVKTGAEAIEAGVDASNATSETEQVDKMTEAITSALMSMGLLGAATKTAGAVRGQYVPENAPFVPRRKFGQAAVREAYGEEFRPTRVDPQAAVERAAELRDRGSNLAADDILQKADPNSYEINLGAEKFTVIESEPGTGRPGAEILDAKGERVFGGTRQQAMEWVTQRMQPSMGPGVAHGAIDTTRSVQVTQERAATAGRPKLDAAQAKVLDAVDFDLGKGTRKTIAQLRAETGLEPAEFDAAFRSLHKADLIQTNRGDMAAMQDVDPAEYVANEADDKHPFVTAVRQGEPDVPHSLSLRDDVILGNKDEADTVGEGNYAVPVRYALVEADAPIASHDTFLNANEGFPEDAQPRDRGRMASEQQIRNITDENLFRPNRLGYSVMASSGAPILDSNLVVESGNGRVIALRRIYESMPAQAEAYRKFLTSKAGMFGLEADQVGAMKKPVLVRIRYGDLPEGISRQQFTVDANADDKAGMSATEQARIDADMLTPELMGMFTPGETGKIDSVDNQDFVRAFKSAAVKDNQQSGFMASDGTISKDGIARVRNAIFFKAYGDPSAMEKLAEDPNPEVGNIITGMLAAAPKFATLQASIDAGSRHSLSIAPEVAKATFRISSLRRQKKNVDDYLNQQELEGRDPLDQALLETLHKYRRSGKRVGQILAAYADEVENLGDPNQISMFALNLPSKLEILEAVETNVAREVESERLAKAEPARGSGEATPADGAAQTAAGNPAAAAVLASVVDPAQPAVTSPPRGKRAQHYAIIQALYATGRTVTVSDLVTQTGLPPKQLAARMTELAVEGRIELKQSTEDASWAEPKAEGMLEAPDGSRYYGAALSEKETARQEKLAAHRHSQKGALRLDFFTGRDPNANDPDDPEFVFSDPEVQERIRIAGRPAQPRTGQDWHQMGRVYRHLPQGKYPVLTFELKRLEKNGSIASAKAQEALRDITWGLTKNQFKDFRKQVVLDDLIATIDRFIKDGKVSEAELQGEDLPFGFTIDSLRKSHQELRDWNSKRPEVQKALEKRERVWDNIRGDFIAQMDRLGIDMRDRFQNRDYFRHRVLTHLQDKVSQGVGRQPGLQTPNRRSHFLARGLNSLDYSTNYIESEYEVMSQIIADTQKARMIAYLKAPSNGLNIIEDLKAEARRLNVQAMMDHFRSQGFKDEEIYAIINWRRPSIVETMGELAFSGGLPDDGGRFEPLVKELSKAYEQSLDEAGGKMKLSSKPEEYAKFIDWMRDYLENAGPASKETRRAVDIATRERRVPQEMLKEILKERLIHWSDLVPETHKEWAPSDGNTFFMVNSIPEQLAKEITESILGEVVTKEDLRRVLALGPKKDPLVLPKEVANTLDELASGKQQGLVRELVRKGMAAWKEYQLLGPGRLFKYNIRNLSGDSEATLAGNPRAFGKVGQSTRELWDWYRNRKGTPNLHLWMERGGFQSSLIVAELGDLQNDKHFRKLMEFDGKLDRSPNLNPWRRWTENVARPLSEFREGILRYANFLEFLEQANAGKLRSYGASRPSDVDALKAPADKAYKLSNDLLGAYDEITQSGQMIRESIPFWSFQELNFRRYKWLIRNAAHDGKLAGLVGRKWLGKAAIRSPYFAFRMGSMIIKFVGLWALTQALNYLQFGDEEDSLQKSIRNRPHVVLGRSGEEKSQYFSRLGNLPDILEWLDPMDHLPLFMDLLNGKIGLGGFAQDAGKNLLLRPANKIVGSMYPPYMTIAQAFAGKNLYPDVTRPRTIRDRSEYIAEHLQMGDLYRYLAGKPMGPPGSAIPSAIKKLFIYESDPKESAYYDIRDLRMEFMKTKGVAEQSFGGSTDPRKEAAYNLKIAVRRQDFEAFRRYLQMYYDAGGTREMLEKSAETFDPLYRMKKDHRKEFIASLNAEDRNRLALANQYYKEIFKSGRLQDYLRKTRDVRRAKAASE